MIDPTTKPKEYVAALDSICCSSKQGSYCCWTDIAHVTCSTHSGGFYTL